MSFEWFWRRAANEAGPRDGQAASLEALRFETPLDASGVGPVPELPGDPRQARLATLHETLGVKLLGAHLANRFQTSTPLVLNLAHYGEVHSGLVMASAAGTLLAVGETSARERLEATERLRRLGADDRQVALFEEALTRPRALAPVLDAVFAAGLAAPAYAVALSILPHRTEIVKLHLAYLAARLKLGPELVGSLKRRFRA